MPIPYALSDEEIAAAQGAFPAGGMSAAPPPPDPAQLTSVRPLSAAPPPGMYDTAAKAFAKVPQDRELPGAPPKPYLLNDDTLAAAQGAFVKRPPPVTPQQAVDGFFAGTPKPPVAKAPGEPSLAGRVAADQRALLRTYDTMQGAKKAEGEEVRAKGQGMSDIYAAEAKRVDDLAATQANQQLQMQEIHHKYLADTNAMIQQVSAEKIDPNAFFHDKDGGINFTAALGALLMGASGALASQDGRNHGLEAINAMIDRNIAAQEKNIANKRAAIGQRQSLYADMRAELGDKILADEKFRAGALESAKNRLLAFSAGSDSKIDARRTEQGVAALEQEKQQALLNFDTRSQQMAAAQSSAAAHRAQQQFNNIVTTRELGIKQQDATTRAAEAATKAAEVAGGGKEHRNKTMELNESANETTHQFDAMAKDPVLDQLGLLPSIAGDTRLSQSLMPESAAVRKRVETLNTRMLQAVGKVAKDADGKPNIAMIERLEHRFSISPSDTKDMALEKLRGAQEVVNALARQQGAESAPDPDAATKLGFKPVKR
jgi:hypothetical protein